LKLPRDLNGEDLCARLTKLGFIRARQSGSHVVLRHSESGESISVPAHRPLKTGTLRRVLRDVQELTGLTLEQLLVELR